MRPAAQLCPKLPLLNCRGAATEKNGFFLWLFTAGILGVSDPVALAHALQVFAGQPHFSIKAKPH